jgi:hypothetical protein
LDFFLTFFAKSTIFISNLYVLYYYMADALISYAITTGVFIGLVVILFASRAKRKVVKKETLNTSEEIKKSPA